MLFALLKTKKKIKILKRHFLKGINACGTYVDRKCYNVELLCFVANKSTNYYWYNKNETNFQLFIIKLFIKVCKN